MAGSRWWSRAAGVFVVMLAWGPAAWAQAGGSSGLGLVAVPGMGSGSGSFGLMAMPMATGAAGQTGQGAGGTSSMVDPLGMGTVYGPAMPMTPGQAGLFMLSAQQRMLGIGNGQLSGVRPGAGSDPRSARRGIVETGSHPAETHTRNSNVPGGQASKFFNRGGLAASHGRPFYNRQLRQFPQGKAGQ